MARRYIFNCVSINSHSKKNIKLGINQILSDSVALRNFLHKILLTRVLEYKGVLLRRCIISSSNNVAHILFGHMCDFVAMYCFCESFAARKMLCLYLQNEPSILLEIFPMYMSYMYSYATYISTHIAYNRASIGAASIPTSINKFTVLRAPQIDKRSREQFEIRTHKRAFSYLYECAPAIQYLYNNRGHATTSNVVWSSSIWKYDSF